MLGIGVREGSDRRIDADAEPAGLVAAAIAEVGHGVRIRIPLDARRAGRRRPLVVVVARGEAGSRIDRGRRRHARRERTRRAVGDHADGGLGQVDDEVGEILRRARAGRNVEAQQPQRFLTGLVVFRVSNADRGLPMLGEGPVDLAERRLGGDLQFRPVVIDAVVAGQVRADAEGGVADSVGQERSVGHRAALVQQRGGDRLGVVFLVVVAADDPLQRTAARGGQVQLIAEPVFLFLVGEPVAGIDHDAGDARKHGVASDEGQLERGDRRLLDRGRAAQVVVIVGAAGDVLQVHVVEVVGPLTGEDRRSGQLHLVGDVTGEFARVILRSLVAGLRQADAVGRHDVGDPGERGRKAGVA